jgi:hypothetical protein
VREQSLKRSKAMSEDRGRKGPAKNAPTRKAPSGGPPSGEPPPGKALAKTTSAKRAPAKKPASAAAAAKKAPAKKAPAKKTSAREATAKKTLAAKRVIAARPPARREPQRGTLRDRLRTAPVRGLGAGDADVVATGPSTPPEPVAAAPRRGTVGEIAVSRHAKILREAKQKKPVVTAPGGKQDRDQSDRQRDRSFGKVLASRDVHAIAAESLKRLEAGRLSDVKTGLQAAEAELKGLRRERERLEKEEDAEKLALIDGYILLAEAEAQAGQALLKFAETARARKGAITLVGRVLAASGKPRVDAEIFFVDDDGEVVPEIAPLKPDARGLVWIGLNKDQAASVIERGGRLSARARVSGKVVAADPFTARVRQGSVYQFDLRIKGDKPGQPSQRPGSPARRGDRTRGG